MRDNGETPEANSEDKRCGDIGKTKLEPLYKSFVNLNFKVEAWYQQRFRYEASLRGVSNKELFEDCFMAYLDTNGGTLDEPRQDLVERFRGKRTRGTRRSRGLDSSPATL